MVSFDQPPAVTAVLSIAGSDSSAGAGIQADLKTAAALNAYCCTALTAVTAQNSESVVSVFPVPKEEIKRQVLAVMESIDIKAIKVGMLGHLGAMEVLIELLENLRSSKKVIPIVLDTVLKATSGKSLLDIGLLKELKEQVLPRASVITPNIAEAAVLLNAEEACNETQMREQAFALLELGVEAVILKGGHLPGDWAIDCLATQTEFKLFKQKKIASLHTHGTGCTLSTALAVYLAKGVQLQNAVALAKQYVSKSIEGAADLSLVEKNGPLNHFNNTYPINES